MDHPQEAPEFILDVFTDPRSVRDVVKAILHTIFFNRFFPSLVPRTRDVLDLTLPYVDDDELETMIEQRASALERQLDAERASSSSNASGASGARGQIAVQFFEKRRRKAWLSRGEEEVCWECWTVKVTVAEPRTESGKIIFTPQSLPPSQPFANSNSPRTSQSPSSHGANSPHHRHENRHLHKRTQRPHPSHHNSRRQPFSLQDKH